MFSRNMKMPKIAVVTGASSGIGLETALALKEKGCIVYDLSRHDANVLGIKHLACDVSNEIQFNKSIEAIIQAEGRIDILINNAGYGISGAAEFTSNDEAKKLLDVNLFGVVNGCKAVLPQMRKQHSGRIINLSSVAAPIAIPFQVWYSISKSSISTYSAALQNETRPFGVSICAVLPGDIHSSFTSSRQKSLLGDDIYNGRIAKSVAVMEHDEINGMSPKTAGSFIASIALRKKIKPEYAIGFKYQLIVVLARLLPCKLKNWIIGLIYAK